MLISVRLPLLIGGVVVAVTGSYGWAAYQTVRRSTATAGTARLGTVVDQLAGTLKASRDQLIAAARTVADSPAVRAYALAPGEARRAAAQAALRWGGLQAQQIAATELWSADRRPLLGVGDTHAWSRPSAARALLDAAADSGAVGPFYPAGDSIGYAVAAPVVAASRVRGYVVQWRRIAQSADTREQNSRLSRLIGSDAHFFIGNAADDVWTDLARRVPPPPVDVTHSAGVLRYEHTGAGPVLAGARLVPKTPWVLLVEFPRDVVLAPARQFLGRLILIGAAILALGLLAAWGASRTLTGPLARLTHAAGAMAAGDYSQPVAVPLRDDELGRLAGAFDVMVTHVRESQQGLEERVRARTAELEDRNAELEAFAYSISHDLRAPLRAMQGFSLALLEDYGDRLDEAGRRYAQRVITAARTMDRLIDDLLAYSRLARAELRLVPLDLGRLMRSSLGQLDGEVQGRAAHITVAEPLPAVVGHGATLAQVFVNLIANAIKFVPADRAPEVLVRAEPQGERVRVWVEDNGIGIAAEHHERIFRVFERLHRAEDYPGTGIGLAIVRKGVERMGGRVGLESALGSGSKFWIDLPRAS
jgi:signal transduction histidine kinase